MTFAIAHRGLHVAAQENSLAAFAAALAHGPVVEVDVRCTHDAVPVCSHDSSLDRTHGVDRSIGELDLAELRTLAPDVPTLEEVLELVADRGAGVMLDVKVARPRAVGAVERAVAASRIAWNDGRQLRRGEPIDGGTATFQSPNATLLQAVRARTGAGCLELVRAGASRRELLVGAPFITTYAQGVTVPDAIASRAILLALGTLQLGTYVYTVNDAERFAELARAGASGVFTDRIDAVG